MTILTTAEHRHVRWNRYNVRKPAQHFDHMDSEQKKVDFEPVLPARVICFHLIKTDRYSCSEIERAERFLLFM